MHFIFKMSLKFQKTNNFLPKKRLIDPNSDANDITPGFHSKPKRRKCKNSNERKYFEEKLLGKKFFGGSKAMEHARKFLAENEVFVRADIRPTYKYHPYFGGLPLTTLKECWQNDWHLYEILSDRRKPYFDLDGHYISKEDEKRLFEAALQIISDLMAEIGAPFTREQLAISSVTGLCNTGSFAGQMKSSFHIIVNNGFVFDSVSDVKTFCGLLAERIENREGGSIIDLSVYRWNQVFKLPYQTKGEDGGSRGGQTPLESRCTLADFLISQDLPSGTKAINMEQWKTNTRQVTPKNSSKKGPRVRAFSGYGNDVTNVFERHYSGKDTTTVPKSAPSWSPEYLVESIFTDHTMPYDIWFRVGSALKRVYVTAEDDGFELFCRWSRKWIDHPEQETKIRRAANFENDQETFWRNFSTERCGYPTLKRLALLCNPELKTLSNGRPWEILFRNELVKTKSTVKNVNTKYIKLDMNRILNKYKTVFVKSPMGTGKSHAIKQLFQNRCRIFDRSANVNVLTFKRVLYLSPKRAFASTMTAEFKRYGFVSYLDDAVRSSKKVLKLFCSLESIDKVVCSHRYRHLYENLDLLIIDESESIFSVVSSETLRANDPVNNIKTFTHLMKTASRVLVIDAHLTDRSVKPIDMLRSLEKSNAFFLSNSYLPEERYCDLVTTNIKQEITTRIDKSLKSGKRCVAVVGSKSFADGLVKCVEKRQPSKEIKYYSCERRLDVNTDVRKEWRSCDLLAYTPTITCGVNFPRVNDDDPSSAGSEEARYRDFDEKFIYTLNIGTCSYREVSQSSHRVRYFTRKTMTFGLSLHFVPNRDQYPVTEIQLQFEYT